MLARTAMGRPSICRGSSKARRSLASTRCASASVSTFSHSTVNSSPARRATVSTWRTAPRMVRAAACSTASPTAWPSLSFTALKPSRSTNTTMQERPLRCARSIASCRRCSNMRRLGRPVSGSWWARWAMASRLRLSSCIWRRICSSMSAKLRASSPSSSWRATGKSPWERPCEKASAARITVRSGPVTTRDTPAASSSAASATTASICSMLRPSCCTSACTAAMGSDRPITRKRPLSGAPWGTRRKA